MDAVVIGAIITVVGSVIVIGVLAIRILKLMNSTHSKD
jgi:hypothetical protein